MTTNFSYTSLWTLMRSTVVELVAYNSKSKQLYVKFKNGQEWIYNGVNSGLYSGLVNSNSPGAFFNDNIRGWQDAEDVKDVQLVSVHSGHSTGPHLSFDATTVDDDLKLTGLNNLIDAIKSSRYVITYDLFGPESVFPGKTYEVTAVSEAGAINVFKSNITDIFGEFDALIKIKAVTHYFD